MKDNAETMKLRAKRPDLFLHDDPIAGLAAVQDAALEYQLMLRALGNLKRSYSARIARSPHLSARKEAERLSIVEKIEQMREAIAREAPLHNDEGRVATEEETDELLAALSKDFGKS